MDQIGLYAANKHSQLTQTTTPTHDSNKDGLLLPTCPFRSRVHPFCTQPRPRPRQYARARRACGTRGQSGVRRTRRPCDWQRKARPMARRERHGAMLREGMAQHLSLRCQGSVTCGDNRRVLLRGCTDSLLFAEGVAETSL